MTTRKDLIDSSFDITREIDAALMDSSQRRTAEAVERTLSSAVRGVNTTGYMTYYDTEFFGIDPGYSLDYCGCLNMPDGSGERYIKECLSDTMPVDPNKADWSGGQLVAMIGFMSYEGIQARNRLNAEMTRDRTYNFKKRCND